MRYVIALGGHAIIPPAEIGTIEQQYAHVATVMRGVGALIEAGHSVVLTHGNGPVVGSILLRGEMARDIVPPMPVYIAVADSEGGIGLMLAQVLHNELVSRGISADIATVVTQTVVSADDPALHSPTKPIGPHMSADDAARRSREDGWAVREMGPRGWRRIVPSPAPVRLVEAPIITRMVEEGATVIAAGGGGVPVLEDESGRLRGVDAVVDKDWTGAVLACAVKADVFMILMEAEAVYADFGTPSARRIDHMSPSQARGLLDSGQLEAGSIGPKLAAAAWAAEECGCRSVICGMGALEALGDEITGTVIER